MECKKDAQIIIYLDCDCFGNQLKPKLPPKNFSLNFEDDLVGLIVGGSTSKNAFFSPKKAPKYQFARQQ